MRNRYPDTIPKFKEHIMQYSDQWKLYILQLIGNVDYFKDTSEKVRQELFYSLK